jgi:hypothetical protein
MIYIPFMLFPIMTIVIGFLTISHLANYVREINRDIREGNN